MHYLALATDYDGTLAHHGHVDASTITALERLIASGRRLLLATGREVRDVAAIFPRLDLFECVVAENGGLLYWPATNKAEPLAEEPSEKLIRVLEVRGVNPLAVGSVVIATCEAHGTTALQAIHDLGLELEIIFNKGSVMILPTGVNKASGLRACLAALGIAAHQVVAVGDAENDHALLSCAGCGVAVANALPALKERADLVMHSPYGAGVTELIERLLATDLADVPNCPRSGRKPGA